MRKNQKKFIAVFVVLTLALVGTCLAGEMEKININTDPIEKLMLLDRVGAKYAQRIIEYRETKGKFIKPEDIMNVPGIGQKTFEANKERIVV